ncbi:5-methylcytosine-specific restriction protein B [Arthrobacter sp. 1088]|uniref:McrB family protein n=1 Tax=Arthrobacter sp. 1088 TaxID=2817768 RepID=UPI0028623897|nr:AAA family ATPase [Arthrobacter sp. 1088]MDR6685769.1 5-methylcytosine-specific restriction protein B [Arthrobacter sp. 1088]
MSSEEPVLTQQYWFVGAFYSDWDPQDQTARFLSQGIWENGFEDRHLDEVRSMRPGDRIAIKSAYVRRNGLPFDNQGQSVSAMAIKAFGTVTRNHGDGRRVDVDWTEFKPPREWYFFTNRSTIWRINPIDWKRRALIDFAFENAEQDIDRFRNDVYWAKRFGDHDPTPEKDFTWSKFYEEMATALLSYRDRRPELLSALGDLQDRHENLNYLTDRDQHGNPVPMDDICPFTVFGSFNRNVSNAKRSAIAGEWANFLRISTPPPSTFDAVPLLNNQNSWFFSYKLERPEGDVDTLWDAFEAALAWADSGDDLNRERFADAYDAARGLHGVGVKLSMGLFWIRPWSYLPLDRQSRTYLRTALMLDGAFYRADGNRYLTLVDTLNAKFSDAEYPVHSFPELSWTAFQGEAASDPSPEPDTDPASDEPTGANLPATVYSVADIIADGCFISRTELVAILSQWRSKKNIILQGPPGTGKTWLARRLAQALIGSKDIPSAIRAVQFHPNMSYEDFVRGWRPGSNGQLTLINGPFLEMVERANTSPDVTHVVLVEEINRGNPVQIFGELLTLIEAGKRSPREALHLAYPRTPEETVHVPSNLYVIGTMNLADRSLAIMDLAFRRRFGFVSLSPALNETWLRWMLTNHAVGQHELEEVQRAVNELNATIVNDSQLGADFMLGHSFATPPQEQPIESFGEWFRGVVATEIIPTLKEYWFDESGRAEREAAKLLDGLL